MKFIKMTKPLAFDVKCNNKVVLPAGTKGVRIAFRQSYLTRYDEDKRIYVPRDVYQYKCQVWHI